MGMLDKLFGRKHEAPQRPMNVVVHDHRDEEEKRIAEEAERGVGVDRETDKMMQLVAEAHSVCEKSGPRLYKEYPQYEPVRSIAQGIYDRGGHEGMLRSYYYIRAQNHMAGGMLDYFWDGIGGWRA